MILYMLNKVNIATSVRRDITSTVYTTEFNRFLRFRR
jgi:hypothetical protein